MVNTVCHSSRSFTDTSTGSKMYLFIAPDKRGYPPIIFLISARKHMLWVLIRSAYHYFSNEKGALSGAMLVQTLGQLP